MYKFTYRTSAFDFLQLSMYSIYYSYKSVVAICNVVFTAVMFLLAVTMWNTVDPIFKMLMIFGCSLFTVIQPLILWNRGRKMAKRILYDTEISFNDRGIHINTNDQNADIFWRNVKKVAKKPTMIIIYSDRIHGYVLTNKVLGKQKKEFYEYVISKINKK